MTDAVIDQTKPGFILKGWHVFAAFAGVFGVTIGVNILFVVLALSTFSGETDQAYLKGLRFNETIAASRAQAEAGWAMQLDLERPVSGPAWLQATMVDRFNQPVRGAVMAGRLGRTTTAADDMALRFEETAPGIYRARLDTLKPGKWRFEAEAKLAGYPDFKTETVLSLR